MNVDGFEIEHKLLIAMPEESFLHAASCSHIVQTYLLGEPMTTERVRARSHADHTEYTHTTKIRLSALKRIEQEETVTREAYEALLTRADPARRSIEKDRYCLDYDGHTLEIDVFPFWKTCALLEVELMREDELFRIPPALRVIREVTDDARYTNSALSLEIPDPSAD